MKKFAYILFLTFFSAASAFAQNAQKNIKLGAPNMERGSSLMKALSERKSTKQFADRALSLADLSDMLWAANGINRPDTGKRTAPSAQNRKDIKIYVCIKSGVYLYDAKEQALLHVSDTDARHKNAPLTLVLVSDFNDKWSQLDAGIVSQNIALFCAANNIGTYPHTTMDVELLKKALNLSGSQTLMLCNSVGYFKFNAK